MSSSTHYISFWRRVFFVLDHQTQYWKLIQNSPENEKRQKYSTTIKVALVKKQNNIQTSCARGLTPAAPSAINIHYWQAAARSGYDYGVVHIKYVVTWTANQSGLLTLTFDLLTLKVVSESRVTWATSVPILVFLDLSVLELGPMYATDVRRHT